MKRSSMKRKNKNITVFRTYMALATRFNLSESKRLELVDILNEPELDDFDIDKIIDRSRRLKRLFDVPAMEVDLAYCEERKKVSEELYLLAN